MANNLYDSVRKHNLNTMEGLLSDHLESKKGGSYKEVVIIQYLEKYHDRKGFCRVIFRHKHCGELAKTDYIKEEIYKHIINQ